MVFISENEFPQFGPIMHKKYIVQNNSENHFRNINNSNKNILIKKQHYNYK